MSITRAQAARLLTLASSWDNRNVGEAAAAAWFESGELGRWSFQEAAQAIKHYYTTTADQKPWVMPSHITAYIRDRRQDRAMRDAAAELVEGSSPLAIGAGDQWLMARNADGLPAAGEAERAAQIARLNAVMPTPRAISEAEVDPAEVRAARRIRCPWCGARPNVDCSRPGPKSTTVRRAIPHPSRIEAAREATS